MKKVKKTKNEFIDFLKDQKIIQLAIAVIIGGAAKDLVNSTVGNIIMPLIEVVTPSGSWREINLKVLSAEFAIGKFLGSLVDFIIIALIVFFVTKKILKIDKPAK